MFYLWRRLFPDEKANFKRIGHLAIEVSRETALTKNKTNFAVTVVFYMNGYGKRRYEYLCSNQKVADDFEQCAVGGVSALVADIKNWKAGGGLPKAFVPEGDVLMDMLNKLVQHKLTGDEFAAQD